MQLQSIFKKQLVFFLGIIVITYVILGLLLSTVFSNYFIGQKEEKLREQGKIFAQECAEILQRGILDSKELGYRIQSLEDYMDASVFLLNNKGEIFLVSSGISESWVGQTITDEAISSVLSGQAVSLQGKVGSMFHEAVLTVGYPIQLRKATLGGIFMCSSLPDIKRSISDMYQAGFICLFFVMLSTSFLIFFFSKKITRPILQMNEAAKVIAGGNFDKRIDIETDDEIGQLAQSFNEMAASLNEHEKVRKDFIANISHDLRSPLTSIQGFLEAILDGTVPKEKTEHYLSVVLDETKRLTKLTNDIMDLSRAESGSILLQIEEFDMNELIRDITKRMESRILQKQIEIELIFEKEQTWVTADPEKMLRVLQNLLDNAIKFTKDKGKIEIETKTGNKQFVFVFLRDNGMGIAEENQRHIFDRFFKVDSSRGEDKKGGGLGLSIAKEIMKAHGGDLTVKSQLGKGTEFQIEVPSDYRISKVPLLENKC